MNPKVLYLKPKVFYRPAASSGAGAWTDISGFFESLEITRNVLAPAGRLGANDSAVLAAAGIKWL